MKLKWMHHSYRYFISFLPPTMPQFNSPSDSLVGELRLFFVKPLRLFKSTLEAQSVSVTKCYKTPKHFKLMLAM